MFNVFIIYYFHKLKIKEKQTLHMCKYLYNYPPFFKLKN